MTIFARQLLTAMLAMLVLTVVLGVLYPLLVWGAGQAVARSAAGGSYLVDGSGQVVGSALVGQSFPGPQWFHGRPSAAGAAGYDAMSSGASNLAADNPELVDAVAERRAAIAAEDGVAPSAVPADALTTSGSGLDPDISPQYAAIQVDRVARARGLPAATVQKLLASHIQQPDLGFLGQPRVNVLEVNLALESLTDQGR